MDRVPEDIEVAFFASKRSEAVPFVINDSVEIVTGPHVGRRGSVIAIVEIEPELELLVELEDGSDVRLPAKHITLPEDAG